MSKEEPKKILNRLSEESIRILRRLCKDKKRYGLNSELFIRYKKCEKCGMTNQESLEKWGQRLQIHHEDNQGRHNQSIGLRPNNDKTNLKILCKSCHPKFDNPMKDYTGRAEKSWETRRRKYGSKGLKQK